MSKLITKSSEITPARFYVLAVDSALSGWGLAEGRKNVIILPCEDYNEAKVVEANTRARSEMRRVRIVGSRPRLRLDVNIYSLFSRKESPRWYRPGGFTSGNGEG